MLENGVRRFAAVMLGLILAASGLPPHALAATEPPATAKESSPVKKSTQERVKVLREERARQMPYLDKDLIRQRIKSEDLLTKEEFSNSDAPRSLDDIIEQAIKIDPRVHAARERIVLSRRRIFAAVRALFPEANFELQQKRGSLSGDKYNSHNFRVNFRQPVFRGGVLWNTLLQEKSGLESAEKEYESIIQEMIGEIEAAFFEYARALETVNAQTNLIKSMQPYLDVDKKKYAEGITSEIEHLNVQSLFSQLQYDHETSIQELELARLDLQKYLDLGLDDDLPILPVWNVDDLLKRESEETKKQGATKDAEGKITMAPSQTPEKLFFETGKPVGALDKLVDLAYQNRPSLQVEAAKLENSRYQERIRWGELMPKCDVIMEYGKLAEAFDINTLDASSRKEFKFGMEFNWNVAGNKASYNFENDERAPSVSQFLAGAGTQTQRNTFSIGLLDGLSDLSAVKEAEVAKLEQIVQLEKAEKEVVKDVKRAYFDYQKFRIRVQSTLQRVDYRQRLARLSEHKLGKNENQISEYIQAQIDLLNEMGNLEKGLSDYYTAKSKLNHAIGLRNYFELETSHGSTDAAKS